MSGIHKAISYAIASVVAFAMMSVCIKILSEHYPVVQIVFFRSIFAFLPIIYMLQKHHLWRSLKTTNISGHLSRSLIGVFSMALNFAAFAYLPLADATAIQFVAPIALTMLSVPLLDERVGPWRWSAVLIGFVGVVIMTSPTAPDNDSAYIGMALGLCAAILAALAMIIVKKMSVTENSLAIVFYFTLISVVLSGAFLPLYWQAPESLFIWGVFIAAGVFGGLGQILTTRSYQHADAAIISPFNYLSIIFAMIFGFTIFGDIPSLLMILGSFIVVASGLIILYREVIRDQFITRVNPMSMQPVTPLKDDIDDTMTAAEVARSEYEIPLPEKAYAAKKNNTPPEPPFETIDIEEEKNDKNTLD